MGDSTISTDTIVIERIFDAPVEIVWQMWAQPEQFAQWYGPQGFTVPVAEMDVRVGGRRLICMEMQASEHNLKMWFTGEYREVAPHTRLVYTDSLADAEGNVLEPSAMGMPDDHPTTTEVTVQLEDLGGRTKMVMTHAGVPADSGGASGWEQAFARLADHINTVLENRQ